jgi:glycerophosphoryl diester phosphodiesterase family protein
MSARARVLLAAVLVALASLLVIGWDRAQLLTGWGLPSRAGPPMQIVAHRGNMERFPEDTAEAIWDAARLGADGIEFDSSSEILRLPTLDAVLDGLAGYDGILILDLQHAMSGDAAELARRVADPRVSIICRTADEVRAVEAADPAILTLLRPDRVDDPAVPVDMLLMDAVTEATVAGVAGSDTPVATFMPDAHAFYVREDVALRRAWAAGVELFLAKELEAALAYRDELAAGGR